MKDYSVTVMDTSGRVAVLSIWGCDLAELISSGVPLTAACDQLEQEAFNAAAEDGRIGEQAGMVCSENHPCP
jgi:hypothetical protein